jgi:anti-sigma factor RsiW
MTCQELVELITAYLERALDAPTTARLEAHLAECDYCRVYVAQMRQTIQTLAMLRHDDGASEAARSRALAQFRVWRGDLAADNGGGRPDPLRPAGPSV